MGRFVICSRDRVFFEAQLLIIKLPELEIEHFFGTELWVFVFIVRKDIKFTSKRFWLASAPSAQRAANVC